MPYPSPSAPFRWFPLGGQRHAVPDGLAPGDEDGQTLCGLPAEIPRKPPPRFPDWCWPECAACDTAWRVHEHIPPRPANLPTPRPPTDHVGKPSTRTGAAS